MVVLRPDFPIDKESERENVIKRLLEDGVSVTNVTLMGKKPLAYPIAKLHEGIYLLAILSSQTGVHASEIEKRARLGGDVIRYLLTVKNA